MFTVFLLNSTVTPPQPGYGQLARAALSGLGAEAEGPSGHFRLADGAELYLLNDPDDDISLLEYPELTEGVAAAVFALAERTGSFVMLHPAQAYVYRTPGNPGEPAADVAHGVRGCGLLETPRDVRDLLDQLEPHAPETQTHSIDPVKPSPSTERGLLQRLSDKIFGRAV